MAGQRTDACHQSAVIVAHIVQSAIPAARSFAMFSRLVRREMAPPHRPAARFRTPLRQLPLLPLLGVIFFSASLPSVQAQGVPSSNNAASCADLAKARAVPCDFDFSKFKDSRQIVGIDGSGAAPGNV